MDEGIKKDIWSVMEDFSKAPGGQDFSKMKAQWLSGMSGLASNPANRQIASSSGASGAPQKKILDFFYFFPPKKP